MSDELRITLIVSAIVLAFIIGMTIGEAGLVPLPDNL